MSLLVWLGMPAAMCPTVSEASKGVFFVCFKSYLGAGVPLFSHQGEQRFVLLLMAGSTFIAEAPQNL